MNYLTRHMQSGLYSLGKITRAPLASFMTCFIIGIALALPVLLFVGVKNAEVMSHNIKGTQQITLYLKQDTTPDQADSLMAMLKKQSHVKSAAAISPAEGLQELQKQAGTTTLTDSLQSNPLPWAITIQPVDEIQSPAQFEALTQTLQQFPLVDSVQLDILWVKRLASLIYLGERAWLVLAIFLSIGVIFIVNNTIRSATQQHHKEIEVIQLIGGTHAFIRRPFLYTGMTYGLFGGIVAWLLIVILIMALQNPVHHLAELYGSPFSLSGLGLGNLVILLCSSALLGLAGSWFAVTRYLYKKA